MSNLNLHNYTPLGVADCHSVIWPYDSIVLVFTFL